MSSAATISPRLLVALVFALLLSAFISVFGVYFPIEGGTVGHDYSLAFPALLDGTIWFRNNGLAAPWFTPSFCAGQPAFADPQIAYYSLPQFLSFAVSPLAAIYLLLLICATSMFWGGYLLMRKVFDSGPAVAILVGGLLMFNGFLPHRIAIGHLSFHGFALAPWLALLLLVPVRRAADGIAAAVAAGVLLAYWVHGAFGTLILAGGLAVALVALLHGLRGGSLKRFLARGVLATLVGLGLSAAKLWAGFSFLSYFARTYYKLPGATSIIDGVTMIAGALFLPSQTAHDLGTRHLTNIQLPMKPHEWAFNFSTVVAVLAVILTVRLLIGLLPRLRRITPHQLALLALLALGLLWPLAFNLWHPGWHAFLKSIPILNSASSAMRWVIVYIPFIAIGMGLLMQASPWKRATPWLVAFCLVATVVQSALEPRNFYRIQNYAVYPVLLADERLRDGSWVPKIFGLGASSAILDGDTIIPLKGNDTIVGDISQAFCYNPIFGYNLEKFSAAGLKSGAALREQDGYLNIKNPACYVFPVENGCKPGDRFRADQIEAARAFIEYRPYPFNISAAQKIANGWTLITSVLVAAGLLAWSGCTLGYRLTGGRRKNPLTRG